MNKLIVRWPAQAGDEYQWLECDSSAQRLADGFCTVEEWPQLVERARGRQLTVLLSARHALITAVTVPTKQQRHLQRVLPFLIEDVVTSSIDDLHIVAGRKLDGERLQAIALSRELLTAVIAQLSAAQLNAQHITIDALCLPSGADAQVLIETQQSLLSLPDGSAHCFAHDNLNQLAPLLIGDNALQCHRADSAIVVSFSDAIDEVDNALAFLALNSADAVNLLQGEFAVKQSFSGQFGQWKWPAVLLSAALFTHYAYALSDWMILSKRHTKLQSEMQTVYAQAFPGTKSDKPYSDMRRQMKVFDGAGSSFLSSLEKISAVLNDGNNQITAINFDSERGDLKLSINADDLAALNSLQADLQSSGATVEMGQATANDNGYSGTLTIHEGKKK